MEPVLPLALLRRRSKPVAVTGDVTVPPVITPADPAIPFIDIPAAFLPIPAPLPPAALDPDEDDDLGNRLPYTLGVRDPGVLADHRGRDGPLLETVGVPARGVPLLPVLTGRPAAAAAAAARPAAAPAAEADATAASAAAIAAVNVADGVVAVALVREVVGVNSGEDGVVDAPDLVR